jgi:hypothetical protein
MDVREPPLSATGVARFRRPVSVRTSLHVLHNNQFDPIQGVNEFSGPVSIHETDPGSSVDRSRWWRISSGGDDVSAFCGGRGDRRSYREMVVAQPTKGETGVTERIIGSSLIGFEDICRAQVIGPPSTSHALLTRLPRPFVS